MNSANTREILEGVTLKGSMLSTPLYIYVLHHLCSAIADGGKTVIMGRAIYMLAISGHLSIPSFHDFKLFVSLNDTSNESAVISQFSQ